MNVLYYQCKWCGTNIPADTKKVYTTCKCGKMSVDGSEFYTRLIGDMKNMKKVYVEPKEEYTYRIKQVSTGLFYGGYRSFSRFTKTGRFYSKKPQLIWVEGSGDCVIEKYKISKL